MENLNDTIEVRADEQLDWTRVEQYLRAHLPEIGEGTIQVRQFPAGASNLTYLLSIGAWEGVLRRPPLGPIAPRAHDMQRESGLLRLIHPVFQLAPRPYIFCSDLEVMDVPFYVMERRRGIIINDTFPTGVTPTPDLCQQLSEALIDTLVQIHAIDWQQAGLAEFGHPDGFLARQVKSWIERYFRSQTDTNPRVEPLVRWFTEHIPPSPQPTLIHNDYKLNNVLMDAQAIVQPRAVLDWEMTTIGDPLFDLAIFLCYWVQPDDPEELQSILPAVTSQQGFLSRADLMQRYALGSGRDLSSLDFYMTFGYFKLSVILQQIYLRWKRGQTHDPRFASFGTHINALIEHASRLIEQ